MLCATGAFGGNLYLRRPVQCGNEIAVFAALPGRVPFDAKTVL
jgi:hypothetical protein